MNRNIILVPTDFTEVAQYSTQHAAVLCQRFRAVMVLLHVVNNSSESESAYTKLANEKQRIKDTYEVECREMVKVGDIFNDISLIAAEIGAKMVIMGTHGVSGWQHVFGSRAMKVITNSKVPFISVQKKSIPEGGYRKIVMPFNVSREPKQQLKLVTDLAKLFGSEIHVLGYIEKNGPATEKIIKEALEYLDSNQVPYVYKSHPSGATFDKHVINYTNEHGADLIAISNLQGGNISLFGGFEQSVIGNGQNLPVMVVNQLDF